MPFLHDDRGVAYGGAVGGGGKGSLTNHFTDGAILHGATSFVGLGRLRPTHFDLARRLEFFAKDRSSVAG
jgi:hypothetical protein